MADATPGPSKQAPKANPTGETAAPRAAGKHKTSKKGSDKTQSSSSAVTRAELKRHKALEKIIDKAAKQARVSQGSPHESPDREQGSGALSPDGGTPSNPQGVDESLFGEVSEPQASAAVQASQGPDPPTIQADDHQEPLPPGISPELAAYLAKVIQRSLAAAPAGRTEAWVQAAAAQAGAQSHSSLERDPEEGHHSSGASHGQAVQDQEVFHGGEELDLELSDDEDFSPERPAFAGLFKSGVFRSLLHKALLTTGLGKPRSESHSASSHPNPLFEEPPAYEEVIPSPRMFREVVSRQWTSLSSGHLPSSSDKLWYSVAPEMEDLLKVPAVDPPVAALSSHSILTGPPEEALSAEDRRAENSLVKTHQSAAWAIKSATASSFFSRAAIMWMRQLRERIPATDVRSHQNINKVMASLEFMADSAMNCSKFSARAIGSSIAARRLLWLRPWQADVRSKWRLASSAYSGGNLFGPPLDPLLTETKDKRKVLSSVSRRSAARASASPSSFRPYRPFRGFYQGGSGFRSSRSFFPSSGRQQDRQGGGGSQRRGQRRPFRGNRSRPFRR